jgi:recombination protein RecA
MTDWMSKLTKSFGKLALDMPSPADSVIRMPSPSLNYVVGNGGLTRGKAAVLFGPESSGKSLLMQLIIKQLLIDTANIGGIAIHHDAEYSFNKDWWLKLCGGDESIASRLIVRQTNDPIYIFDYIAGDMAEALQDGAPIVGLSVDSVKSILYPKDRKNKTTDLTMGGGGASYLGPALKLILPVIRTYNITTLFVQQVYQELDQYKAMSNPYVIPDGRALKHWADLMLEVTRVDTKAGRIEDGKNIYGGALQIGHKVRVRGKKNRIGAPFRAGEFTLSYTGGIINVHDELFDLAKALGVIKKPSPVSYQFADYEIVRGEQAMRDWLKAHPELHREIEDACTNVGDEQVQKHNKELGYEDVSFDPSELD